MRQKGGPNQQWLSWLCIYGLITSHEAKGWSEPTVALMVVYLCSQFRYTGSWLGCMSCELHHSHHRDVQDGDTSCHRPEHENRMREIQSRTRSCQPPHGPAHMIKIPVCSPKAFFCSPKALGPSLFTKGLRDDPQNPLRNGR